MQFKVLPFQHKKIVSIAVGIASAFKNYKHMPKLQYSICV